MSQVPARSPLKPRRIKPDRLPEVTHHTTLELQAVEQGRAPSGLTTQDVNRLARAVSSSLGHLKKQIDSSGLYEFVFTKEQVRLMRSGALKLDDTTRGLYGFLRRTDTGKFAARVPLKEVSPALADSLVSLPVQLGVEAITLRLEAIERKIEAIHQGQRWDRMARLRAGHDLLNTALKIGDANLRRELLRDAACQLVLGKALLGEELYREIADLKVKIADPSFFQRVREFLPGESTSAEVGRRLSPLRENVIGVLTATRFEVAALALLGEDEAAFDAVARTRKELAEVAPDVAKLSRQIYIGIGASEPEAARYWTEELRSEVEQLEAVEQKGLALCSGPLVICCEGRHLLEGGTESDDATEDL